jgi:hypothetical protein
MKFDLLSSASLIALGTALAVAAPEAAHATLEQHLFTPATHYTTNKTAVFYMPYFSATKGTLNSVTVKESGGYSITGFEKFKLGTGAATMKDQVSLSLFGATPSSPLQHTLYLNKTATKQVNLGAVASTLTFTFNKTGTLGTTSFSTTAAAASFVGTGTFGLKLNAQGNASASANAPTFTASVSTFVTPTFEVDYNYTASSPTETPEPASMALLGVGLTGVGVLRRRRKR